MLLHCPIDFITATCCLPVSTHPRVMHLRLRSARFDSTQLYAVLTGASLLIILRVVSTEGLEPSHQVVTLGRKLLYRRDTQCAARN